MGIPIGAALAAAQAGKALYDSVKSSKAKIMAEEGDWSLENMEAPNTTKLNKIREKFRRGAGITKDQLTDPEKLGKWLSFIQVAGPLVGKVLSDEDMKEIEGLKQRVPPQAYIKHLLESGQKLEPYQVRIMLKAFKHPNEKCRNEEAHIWKDSVLNDYMKHIKNYKYHYKDEAQQLDPSIDPETEHIGPMAQDIEEVNPAAVITDKSSGYKSVDTGRLALMNAGAIAELAREIADIKKRLD